LYAGAIPLVEVEHCELKWQQASFCVYLSIDEEKI
jgi:hypothetical protein